MTTPARQAEANEASIAFHVALTYIGAETIKDALAMWQEVPASEAGTTATGWLDRAVRLVMFRRRQSRALALAYYRLARALRTGSTITDPFGPEPTRITMGQLRAEFAALVAEHLQRDPGDISGEGDSDAVPAEEIPGLKEALEADERRAQAEATEDLKALGPDNLGSKLKKVKTDRLATEVDAERQKAHGEAGSRQASASQRLAMNGGRGATWTTASKDKKALGWARVSGTGTPCGFCGMLISRGAVYRSKNSAETTGGVVSNFGDGNAYHPNCKCYAEPIFTYEQYRNDPRFDLNRSLEKLWNAEIKDKYSGNDALNAFRTLLRNTQKANAQAA